MTHIHKGQLTASGEWAKHLRPPQRRIFWGGERSAARDLIRQELNEHSKDELPRRQGKAKLKVEELIK